MRSEAGLPADFLEQLRQAALYDEVTGLPNRKLFLDRLSGVTDPETKRKVIGGAFIDVF